MASQLVVFVHGWSVTSTATYGELPARLKNAAARRGGPDIDVRQIFLGEYVSFHDEVRLRDIARAFDAALSRVLADAGGKRRRCVCITHSTGGPVVREWLDRHVVEAGTLEACPISHLIMLAPANFGSALAQLGKGRIGAIKAWFDGVEPGQGVLDWLELGSPESCALNLRWIHDYPALGLTRGRNPLFPFVLSGDSIDRKLYDHLNPYTGEKGSDGVVRLASANLNATHVVLRQPAPRPGERLPSARKRLRALELDTTERAAPCAFRIIPGASHSGTDRGIMAAVRNDDAPNATVDAVLRCLEVTDHAGYERLRRAFADENAVHQRPANRLETEHVPVLPDREYIHDPCSMVLVRLFDSSGLRVPDVDVLLTAGPRNDPNELPSGFLVDRQANSRQRANLSLFLNHSVLDGCAVIPRPDGGIARPALTPRPPYGLCLRPRGGERFVEYWNAAMDASVQALMPLIRPNETTLVDVHLSRIVREGVFGFTRQLAPPHSFKDVTPGGAL